MKTLHEWIAKGSISSEIAEKSGFTELVRCKDCRYGQHCTDRKTTYQCFKWNSGEFGVLHEQDWFCADGERKSADEILMEKWDADPLG